MDLSISNIINISVAAANLGIGQYNTSNVAIFTREARANSFGNLGYKIYKSPTQVGVDFGTNSDTYLMALSIFGQAPNILANGGYLVIMPMLTAAQTAVQQVAFDGIPASGTFELNYATHDSAAINWNDTAAQIQTKLRAVTGLSTVVVSGAIPTTEAPDAVLEITFTGISGAVANLTVDSNSLEDVSSNAVTPLVTTLVPGSAAETLDQAILRTIGLVQYFGILAAEITPQTVMLLSAALVQTLNKIAFFPSHTQADVAPGGMLDLLRTGGYKQSRGLYYGGDGTAAEAVSMAAAYAGRNLSTIFSGSQTTQNPQLKTLVNVQPDPTMTQTLYNQCQAAGVDVYASIQGDPGILVSGANDFFANQYNLQWYVGALQVAGFNTIAQAATKIPQTESGISSLKGAYRKVSDQGDTNGFIAPGEWTLPDTFGVQEDFYNNIRQFGYYIYSQPVAQQSPSDRQAGKAPLIQIAIKYAGQVNTSDALIFVNA